MRLAAVNRAASRAGLVPGQSLADARALEPELDAVEADPAADRAALDALAHWALRYTPWVAPDAFQAYEAAGLWLDLTGCAHFFAAATMLESEAALIDDLLSHLSRLGYGARVGLADTAGAAWAAARFAGARTAARVIVPPEEHETLLADLPVAGLRLDDATRENLDRLGLRRIGDLTGMPRAGLAGRFGPLLARRLDQAFGREDEPISALAPAPDLHVRMDFAEPIGRLEDIRAAVRKLVENLAAELEINSLGLRRVELRLHRLSGRIECVTIGTAHATRSVAHLVRLIDGQLEQVATPPGGDDLPENFVEAIALKVRARAPLAPLQSAVTGLEMQETEPAPINWLVDRLIGRLGADAVIRLEPQASHLPERAQNPILLGAEEVSPSAAPLCVVPLARPPRLLSRPEPVFVVAPIPDDPPVLFRWRDHVHHIVRVDGPERLTAEWWRPASPLSAATRDYYRVEDRDGARFWLYRAGLYREGAAAPPWFLHGFFG
ncbi:MAG: DNA polymerase Y family protein [Alphaproteobacteria bacterium]|nr:DNA polymerase Y family protein [Alphaproteobacteria bacterium]